MKNFSILIGADMVPTKSNEELFISKNIQKLLGSELWKELRNSEGMIFNLEVPLTDSDDIINKNGPCLKANPKTIAGIKELKPLVCTLANNHIMDFGEKGLDDTTELLSKWSVPYVGVGTNLTEARKGYIVSINEDVKLGVYACAEHEFSIATEETKGANPFDILESFNHIKELKKHCNYLIVMYHGGKEHYRYPSPVLQQVCRKMVNNGADMVVCQQSHCIGAYEEFEHGTIVYGQGNFISDYSNFEEWETSVLIKLVYEQGNFSVKYLPIMKKNNVVAIAKENESKKILGGMKKRSEQIREKGFVEKNYNEYANMELWKYLKILHGSSFFFKAVNKLSGHKLLYLLYNRKKLTKLLNIVECEPHREMIMAGIKSRI